MSQPPSKIPPPPPVSRPSTQPTSFGGGGTNVGTGGGAPSPPRNGPKLIPPPLDASVRKTAVPPPSNNNTTGGQQPLKTAVLPPQQQQQPQQQQSPTKRPVAASTFDNTSNVNPLISSASASYSNMPSPTSPSSTSNTRNAPPGSTSNTGGYAPLNATASSGTSQAYAPSPTAQQPQTQPNQQGAPFYGGNTNTNTNIMNNNNSAFGGAGQQQQPLAPQTSVGSVGGAPKLIGSASVSHPQVPQVKRRPSPVRHTENTPANNTNTNNINNNNTSGYANLPNQQQQQPPPLNRAALGQTSPTKSASFAPSVFGGQNQQNQAAPNNNTSAASTSGFAQQPRVGGLSPPSTRPPSSSMGNNNRPPTTVSPPRTMPNYGNMNINNNNNASNIISNASNIINNTSNIINAAANTSNNNINNNGGVSPIPIQSSLVASPPRSATGRPQNPTLNTQNVTWIDQENARAESLRRYERDMSVSRQAVSGASARRLPPPQDDALHTSVVTEQVDTVGLHRTNIQDAINSSHYAVSGSQFPLSVVPQSKSKTRNMTSTVDGCISVEILVMVNGAHGSGLTSKCDEVRIVNVDPARTTIRRLLNLAHKAINFVPVTRGAFQMSARTLATRRISNQGKPVITPIPYPNDISSITEMITLSEEDLVESIPIRDNDVLNWVEVDPVITPAFSAGSPNTERSVYKQQDMRLIGSPNRDIVAATRLPRAVHDPREFAYESSIIATSYNSNAPGTYSNGLPERVISVPLAQEHLEFERMSPRRELRKEPGNGNASLAHRQVSGKISASAAASNNNNNAMFSSSSSSTSAPSWRNSNNMNLNGSAVDETNRRIESLNSTPLKTNSNYSAIRNINNNGDVPHSSIAQYANSSLRSASNNNTSAASFYGSNNSPYANNRQVASTTTTANPISLSSGEVIYPRSEEERRLVDEIRAIRRDISGARN